jgi:type II secretory pathway pseudopilin PulG
MKLSAPTRRTCSREQGYVMVLLMFFLALLILTTVVAAPTVISSIQREKEKEMVWRGKQYTRAIRMYYLKNKRFPTSLDDLTKPKTGLRFMRQAYKDPMNPVDGSWRLIFVSATGQLVGSLNPQTQQSFGTFPGMQQMAGAAQTGAFGTPAGSQTSSFGNSSFGNSTFGNSSFGNSSGNSTFGNSSFGNSNSSFGNNNSSFGNSSFGNNNSSFGSVAANGNSPNGTANANPTDPNAQNGATTDQMGTPQPLQMMDSSNTIGGNIIGVGSKVNKASFLWYNKAKNYQLFEFIWDPSKDTRTGGASAGIGTPVQNLNGTNSNGMNGNGVNGVGPNGNNTGFGGNNFGNNSGFGANGFGNNSNQNPPQQNQNLNNPDPNSNPPLQAPQN